jgi:diguanylate cyclase (GGDEF)-like protein
MTTVSADAPPEAATRAALRTVREMIARAHSLGSAETDEEVLEQAAHIACDVLGYRECAFALRHEDGGFRCGATPPRGPGGELTVTASGYEEVCQVAVPLEGGSLWLPQGAFAGASSGTSPSTSSGTSPPDGPSGPPRWFYGRLWAPVVSADGTHAGFISPHQPAGIGLGAGSPPPYLEALLLGVLAGLAELGLELSRINTARRKAASLAESKRRQLEDLISASLDVRGEAALDNVLSGIARAMASGVGFRRAAVWLTGVRPGRGLVHLGTGFERGQDATLEPVPVHLAATVGISAEEASRLSREWSSLALFAPVMRPEMRLSRSYLWDHRRCEYTGDIRDKLLPGPPHADWSDGMWHSEDSLTVPLEDRQSNLLGLISMDEPLSGALPTRDECRSLEFFADQCALAVVEARRLEAALEEATTDELTGLANRRGLLERGPLMIGQAKRDGPSCSALYIDIDHFKDINDSFGHALGDEVIREVGHTIARRMRRGDLIARYGGEEFIVLLPATSLEEAAVLAEQIRELVGNTHPVEVHPPIRLYVSIGVASAKPGDDTQSLLRAADSALYQAKRSGRNRVCVAAS